MDICDWPAVDPQISFAPLAGLPLLRRLKISQSWGETEQLSDAQADELREMPRLQEVEVAMTTPLLCRLLRQPHDLQWQQLSLPRPLDDEAAALLPQLLSLTTINDYVWCERFDWLRGLTSLTEIGLLFVISKGAAARRASLVAGLQCCANIEVLRLGYCADLTEGQLADLLPRLPKLRELHLSRLLIDSLAFLSQAPLTNQLRGLRVNGCRRLPTDELRHVHTLRGLQKLVLDYSFTVPLDDASRALLTPPSLLLPRLEEFVC